MEQQQQIAIQNLERDWRFAYLIRLNSLEDTELAVWMLVEEDVEISRALCAEWLSRHPEC